MNAPTPKTPPGPPQARGVSHVPGSPKDPNKPDNFRRFERLYPPRDLNAVQVRVDPAVGAAIRETLIKAGLLRPYGTYKEQVFRHSEPTLVLLGTPAERRALKRPHIYQNGDDR